MQRGAKEPAGTGQSMRIADLRASVRGGINEGVAKAPKLPKPPKPRKGVIRDSEEERAIKAEKAALAHHRTSLLTNKENTKSYVRPGEKPERKGSLAGLLVQLVLVLLVAGGVAYALDPTIVPAEWQQKAHEFISQYVTI